MMRRYLLGQLAMRYDVTGICSNVSKKYIKAIIRRSMLHDSLTSNNQPSLSSATA